jgi:hypothetical protein
MKLQQEPVGGLKAAVAGSIEQRNTISNSYYACM